MKLSHEAPRVRILHCVHRLDRGGLETWLLHLLRRLNLQQCTVDILVNSEQPGAYDDDVRALGIRIISCGSPRHPWRYREQFLRLMLTHGPYDIVHAHTHFFSGMVARLAHDAGVPCIITHSHADTRREDASCHPWRWGYRWLMRRWVTTYATMGFATSANAAAALYGPAWRNDERWRLLYSGIDLDAYVEPVERRDVRADLGLPLDALVLGHVGRLERVKNHDLLLRVTAELIRDDPRWRLLLVGDGAWRWRLEGQAAQLGIRDHVVFAGGRTDVPRILKGAVDVFCFPSHAEGLGLACIEAQAAAVPCVIADVVPPEADVVPGMIYRLPCYASPAVWAATIRHARVAEGPSARSAYEMVVDSSFNIAVSVRTLEDLYGVLAKSAQPRPLAGER